MKITEFLSAKKAESAEAVKALRQHEATREAMLTEYNKLDEECIPLARELMALAAAGSPRQFEAQAKLKQARWNRDGVKNAWSRKRDALLREVQRFTDELIRLFHFRCLDLIAGLSKLYNFRRLETVKNPWTDKITVKIQHNAAALNAARDLIFRRLREVHDLQTSSLAELEKKIAACENEFRELDTSTLEVEEVNESAAGMMRPQPSLSVDRGAVESLSARITALERT